MTRRWHVRALSALLVLVLTALAAGAAAAENDPRGQPARVDWTPDWVVTSMRPGETIVTTVALQVSAPVRAPSFEFLPLVDADRATIRVEAGGLPARLEAG